jgi:hypothetical protein
MNLQPKHSPSRQYQLRSGSPKPESAPNGDFFSSLLGFLGCGQLDDLVHAF